MTKQETRQLMRRLKKQHTQEELSALSQKATDSLLKRIHQEENCQTVLLYHSLPDEVETHLLIRTLAAEGKKVLLPTIAGTELELHEYIDEQAFCTSESFGIQESKGPLFTSYSRIDLAIIPGLAFTKQGERLGRGKGFYDRLLPKLHCPLIGLAFPFQLIDSIPCEPHDIRMDEIISQ